MPTVKEALGGWIDKVYPEGIPSEKDRITPNIGRSLEVGYVMDLLDKEPHTIKQIYDKSKKDIKYGVYRSKLYEILSKLVKKGVVQWEGSSEIERYDYLYSITKYYRDCLLVDSLKMDPFYSEGISISFDKGNSNRYSFEPTLKGARLAEKVAKKFKDKSCMVVDKDTKVPVPKYVSASTSKRKRRVISLKGNRPRKIENVTESMFKVYWEGVSKQVGERTSLAQIVEVSQGTYTVSVKGYKDQIGNDLSILHLVCTDLLKDYL